MHVAQGSLCASSLPICCLRLPTCTAVGAGSRFPGQAATPLPAFCFEVRRPVEALTRLYMQKVPNGRKSPERRGKVRNLRPPAATASSGPQAQPVGSPQAHRQTFCSWLLRRIQLAVCRTRARRCADLASPPKSNSQNRRTSLLCELRAAPLPLGALLASDPASASVAARRLCRLPSSDLRSASISLERFFQLPTCCRQLTEGLCNSASSTPICATSCSHAACSKQLEAVCAVMTRGSAAVGRPVAWHVQGPLHGGHPQADPRISRSLPGTARTTARKVQAPPAGGAVPDSNGSDQLPTLRAPSVLLILLLHCSLLRPQVRNLALASRSQARHPASSITSVSRGMDEQVLHTLLPPLRTVHKMLSAFSRHASRFCASRPCSTSQTGPCGTMSRSRRAAASLLLFSDLALPSLSTQGPKSLQKSPALVSNTPELYFERLPPALHNDCHHIRIIFFLNVPCIRQKARFLQQGLGIWPMLQTLDLSACTKRCLQDARTRSCPEASDYRAVALVAVSWLILCSDAQWVQPFKVDYVTLIHTKCIHVCMQPLRARRSPSHPGEQPPCWPGLRRCNSNGSQMHGHGDFDGLQSS